MRKINLPIVFHFHQPFDNFPWVFEESYEKAYQPLIDHIYEFPEIKITLHFSGGLLKWFIDNKPKFVQKLKEMAKRKQIEIIGGGYYEPIYAVIPYRDKIAQMRKLSELIEDEFGLEVNGAWLAERVWEPNYPSFLNDVGLKYVILDDNHFRSTGISEDETLYSYNTEDNGKSLRIFPINEQLRYLTPWKPTTHSVDYLKTLTDQNGDRIALLISDAEKMGVWGSTHQICYIDGNGHQEGDNGKPFIPTLFKRIIENDWIISITLSEYMKKYPAKGLVYLPTASYDKMEEWVLPTKIRRKFETKREKLREDINQKDLYLFLKGGFWRHYLVKYPEANNMHKKMLYVRDKLIGIEKKIENLNSHNQKENINRLLSNAWEEIYKSQCNDPYWHGLFGGVYLQFLRFAIYSHLIEAENIIDKINKILYPKLDSYISLLPIDFNKDSKMDILIESNIMNLYANPTNGGTIFELDYKPKSYNFLNTLSRWEEAYHEKEKIENGEIFVDKFRKSMLRLRFFSMNKENNYLKELKSNNYTELGDFVNGEFIIIRNEKEGEEAILELKREGIVNLSDPSEESLESIITKRIILRKNQLKIQIEGRIKEKSRNKELLKRENESIMIGIDFPFFFNGDPNDFIWNSDDLDILENDKKDLLSDYEYSGSHFKAIDKTYELSYELKINTPKPYKIIKFPLISYTYTDEGYKDIYQGINIIPIFNLKSDFKIDINVIIN